MSIKQFKNGGLIPLAGLNSFADASDIDDVLNSKQNILTFDNAPTDGSSNPVTSDGIYNAMANLGANLLQTVRDDMIPEAIASIPSGGTSYTFDTTPTEGSSNPVTSDGIKSAIDAAISSFGGGSGSSVTLYSSTGQNTDGAMTQKAVSDALDAKANQSAIEALTQIINEKASQTDLTALASTVSGKANAGDIPKLYSTTGQNTDGAMTQKVVTDILGDISAALDAINGIVDTTIQN